MFPITKTLLTVIAVVLVGNAFGAAQLDPEVREILEGKCIRCHGAGKTKGGLKMHTHESLLAGGSSGSVLIPGRPSESELLFRVSLPHEHEDIMPQETAPLTPAEIGALRRWIENGAPWDAGLKLSASSSQTSVPVEQLLERAPPESVEQAAAQLDDILAEETKLLSPSSHPKIRSIDDLAFLRRTTVDLIGRIPTLSEIRTYQSWAPEERRRKLVKDLISNPRFDDRWSVFFSDMLRVRTRSPGGAQFFAYVHRSLKDRKPYDELAREIISANGRPNSNPAVGFVLADDADPMILAGATSQIFLGVRLACAECHDHPFDDWSQRQFYELAAYFGRTERIENRFANTVFAADRANSSVLWPPEREQPSERDAVEPQFPFHHGAPAVHGHQAAHIRRLDELRKPDAESVAGTQGDLDSLLDRKLSLSEERNSELPDIAREAHKESAALGSEANLSRTSELRAVLANEITDPANPYFARAFVNRVWHELIGRGFVEPIDNFSAYKKINHPTTLEFLAREFVASGFDFRGLVEMIALSDVYARATADDELSTAKQEHAERSFIISPSRRMLSETLFDSILVAGHLFESKWPAGANVRKRTRQIRVPIEDSGSATSAPSSRMGMTAMSAAVGAGYDLESGIEIDFDSALSRTRANESEIDRMRMDADLQLQRDQEIAMMRAASSDQMRYRIETIEEEVDDNPVFSSTMRMATPAPPAHFLRVFGQPPRDGLGEFRDHAPSLRQELMMLNGRATHEAARVGPLEPIYSLLNGVTTDLPAAITMAYLEVLTRHPSDAEVEDALGILDTASSPNEGMADLRWALLNCHEFRYIP